MCTYQYIKGALLDNIKRSIRNDYRLDDNFEKFFYNFILIETNRIIHKHIIIMTWITLNDFAGFHFDLEWR